MGLTPLSLGRQAGVLAVNEAMTAAGCPHLQGMPYPQLSGGERQRVHFARVLLQLSQAELPPLLLLDEPTSAQDLGQQHQMLSLVRSLCESTGMLAIAVLHDVNQALRYSHRCTLVDSGQIAASGLPSEVLTAENVAQYWQYRPATFSNEQGEVVLA